MNGDETNLHPQFSSWAPSSLTECRPGKSTSMPLSQCVATGSEIEIITLFLKTALVWKNMGTQTEGEKASKK